MVRLSDTVYPDETGWKVGGRPHWLWDFVTDLFTWYVIRPSRGLSVPAEVLEMDYTGCLVHDGWAPYDRFLHALALARGVVNTLYHISRTTSSISVTVTERRPCGPGPLGSIHNCTVAALTAVPSPTPLGNDVLVTVPSALGTGTFSSRAGNAATFTGASGRNHSSVANATTATGTATAWIVLVERSTGDLK